MRTAFPAPRASRRVLAQQTKPAASRALLVAAALLAACTSDEPRAITLVRVTPAADPACGAPADGRTLIIEALGDFPASEATARSIEVGADAVADIASFPPETRALTVEVIGAGGAISAVGQSVPFAGQLGELPAGAEVPVLMAPPLGACPTGPPALARLRPLLARAGAGVLVAGGIDGTGAPVHAVEYYDPATAAFTILAERLYGTDDHGLAGASATAASDGRVVIAGGPVPAYQVYDPATGAFSAELFLNRGARAFHAAVALAPPGGAPGGTGDGAAGDAGARVLLAGGCSTLDTGDGGDAAGACAEGTALRTTSILDLDSVTVDDGPALMLERIGGVAVVESPGAVLLVGGVDGTGAPVTTAERIDPTGERPSQLVPGLGASAARLPSGSVLSAFAATGSAPAANGVVLPAGAGAASPILEAAARAGVTLTALSDGRVLALGGGAPLLFEPIQNRFLRLPATNLDFVPAAAGHVPEHGAVLLDDGTVLVLGGRLADDAGAPRAWPRAWIVRPELTGPWAGDATASFTDLDFARLAVPRDPRQGGFVGEDAPGGATAHYLLQSSSNTGLPSEWLILAGPIFGRVSIEVQGRAVRSGVAVLFGFRDAATHMALVMLPGQPATLFQIEAGAVRDVGACTASIISAAALAGGDEPARIQVRVDTRAVTAVLDGEEVLSCTGQGAPAPGHVGVGVLGATDATLRIDALAARRLE